MRRVFPSKKALWFTAALAALLLVFVVLVFATLASGTAHAQQRGYGSDSNLPGWAAPGRSSRGTQPPGGGRREKRIDPPGERGFPERRPPSGGRGYGPLEPVPGPQRPTPKCQACGNPPRTPNTPTQAPIGGLEWLALAGGGYALHRLRRREDGERSEDGNAPDGDDPLP